MTASVLSIFVCPQAAAPMHAVEEAQLEKSRGIVGDRYYAGSGTFSEKLSGSPDSEVTLAESEQIDAFNREHDLELEYSDLRRNIVTVGVDLNELVGVDFRVGETVLHGIRLCEPCAHLANLTTSKVLPGLVHRAGLRAKIVSAGAIRCGDAIDVA